MKRVRRAGVVVLGASVAAALASGLAAAAAVPAPVTIQEVSVSAGPHQPPTGTFVASGLDGCSSGTFSDHLIAFSPSGARVKVDRTYACASGGGFTARVDLHVSAADAAGQAVDGRWRIVSSEGLQPAPEGSGSVVGENTGCAPIGAIFAECTGGTGTVTATVH